MKWAWRIGRLAGIDVYVHATFLILVIWVGAAHFMRRGSWGDAISGLAFIAALFAIIVLHELGHALTARRFGIRTRDITLLPIGGLARLERMPDDPRQELWVALAGPAVNVALALLLMVLLLVGGHWADVLSVQFVGGAWLAKLLWVNVALAVFNLLPAFPMDGGRVLRALLALNMDYVRATQIAANVGQAMALVFGFAGMLYNPFLLFIALFVWMGAAYEAEMVAVRAGLSGVPVREAMITEFHALRPDDTVQQAVDYILAGFQHDFPVVEDGRVVGILTRGDVTQTLARRGPDTPVGEIMQREFETIDPGDMLERAFEKLAACHCPTVPVVRDGQLVGLLNHENIGEFLAFHPYTRRRMDQPQPADAV
ncbi:MAG: CBS domain-containing protein [Planctomycetota bacterium]|nr:MAG: CBS domain-containing protein [Planctomycetota bacterium]